MTALRHGAAALMSFPGRSTGTIHSPLTAREAIDNGASVEATARAIARSWVRQYGHRGACDLIDAMQDEARRASHG